MADTFDRLATGAAEISPQGGLAEKLALGRPLRVKLGVDPSRPDLTLGHSVVLRKLRQFQDEGHIAVLIIGDFTGRIGDPSGRSDTRPMVSVDELEANAQTYLDQAGKVLNVAKAEIRHNAEWLATMDMDGLIRLASVATVARMLERDDFKQRYQNEQPISVVEFLYPLLQGYDSVAVRADVELGGTDQTFNLLMGREVQRANGQEPQLVLTMPLLEGTDGVRKMSKSFDNYIGLSEPPDDQFGKLMSIPDQLIVKYLRLCTLADPKEADAIEAGLADGSLHPNEQKRLMARRIVELYNGGGSGQDAESRFDLVHRDHEVPQDVASIPIPPAALRDGRVWLPRLLSATGLAASNGEARRAIEQGAVRINGELVTDPEADFAPDELRGSVLQLGRRRFVKLV